MSDNNPHTPTLNPEMYFAMAEHRANYAVMNRTAFKTETSLDHAWREHLTEAWLKDFPEQRGLLRCVRNHVGIQEAFTQFGVMKSRKAASLSNIAEHVKSLLLRIRDFNQDLNDRQVVPVLDGGDEFNGLLHIVEEGLDNALIAAVLPGEPNDVPGMSYIIKGPVAEGIQLYWSMKTGWCSRNEATPIPHSQIAKGMLLVGATGADILYGDTSALLMDDALALAHRSVLDLQSHKIEGMLVLVASTAHVTEEENQSLELNAMQESCPGQHLQVAFSGEYGWLFYIGDELTGITEGLSEGFAGAIRFAQAHGFDWLRLDRDADRLPGMTTYEW